METAARWPRSRRTPDIRMTGFQSFLLEHSCFKLAGSGSSAIITSNIVYTFSGIGMANRRGEQPERACELGGIHTSAFRLPALLPF